MYVTWLRLDIFFLHIYLNSHTFILRHWEGYIFKKSKWKSLWAAHHRQGRLLHPREKLIKKGSPVGQLWKGKAKWNGEEGAHVLDVASLSMWSGKQASGPSLRAWAASRVWKLFTTSFVYQGSPLGHRTRHRETNQTWMVPAHEEPLF